MKIELIKNRILETDPWWFELGVSCQKAIWHKKKYLVTVALCFWSIHIRWGVNK